MIRYAITRKPSCGGTTAGVATSRPFLICKPLSARAPTAQCHTAEMRCVEFLAPYQNRAQNRPRPSVFHYRARSLVAARYFSQYKARAQNEFCGYRSTNATPKYAARKVCRGVHFLADAFGGYIVTRAQRLPRGIARNVCIGRRCANALQPRSFPRHPLARKVFRGALIPLAHSMNTCYLARKVCRGVHHR